MTELSRNHLHREVISAHEGSFDMIKTHLLHPLSRARALLFTAEFTSHGFDLDTLLNTAECRLTELRLQDVQRETRQEILELLISTNNTISSLFISDLDEDNYVLEDLVPILTNSRCKVTLLTVRGDLFTGQELAVFFRGVLSHPNCKLKLLEIEGPSSERTEQGEEILALGEAMRTNCRLQHLAFESFKVNPDCMEAFGEGLLHARLLNCLNIKMCPLHYNSVNVLARTIRDPRCRIRTLSLSRSLLTGNDAMIILDAVKSSIVTLASGLNTRDMFSAQELEIRHLQNVLRSVWFKKICAIVSPKDVTRLIQADRALCLLSKDIICRIAAALPFT